MPEYVNLTVVVAADGSLVDSTFVQDQVAHIRIQPFGSGTYDVAFVANVDASQECSVMTATSAEGDATVKALYCNFSADFSETGRKYAHQITVRVQTSQEQAPANCGFSLDLQLA